MGFHIDPIVFSVRGGIEFEAYGDDYEFVMTVQSFAGVALISSTAGEMPKKDRERFRLELIKLGFTIAIWQRSRGKNILWMLEANKMETL